MVFPSQANETKTAILRALEGYNSPEKGLGYNKLFEAVKKKVGGSRRTFHKYLSELVATGAVRKEKDPRHKAGVTIYGTEAATQEQVLIELTDRIFEITKPPEIITQRIIKGEVIARARVALKRGILKKEGITDDDLREIIESTKIWRMAQVSDVLGRYFSRLMNEYYPWKEMTYAYGRIVKDAEGKERAEINLVSDDNRQSAGLYAESPGEQPLAGMMRIAHTRSIVVPYPPDKSRDEALEEIKSIDVSTDEGVTKASEKVQEILARYPSAERERIMKEMEKFA
jgi:DNA-binding transcriptional ArsR family regulator